ncbi:MAG TPA: hypothetical protein ENG15_00590 [Thermotoga sp.]|nr:hypothetical protein [Thermotoga sp.]
MVVLELKMRIVDICRLDDVEPNSLYYLIYLYRIKNETDEGIEYEGRKVVLSGKALEFVARRLALRGKKKLLWKIRMEDEGKSHRVMSAEKIGELRRKMFGR